MACPTLRTPRLLLRPLALVDLADLTALHAQESFWHYPFGRPWSGSETEEFLERRLKAYAESVPAISAVVIAETNELTGWAGLSEPTFLPEILPAIEVGWRLGEQHRGYGYATEAGTAWIEYGFTDLALEKIVSIYEPENTACGAVMKRLGFALDRTTTYREPSVEVHVMSLTREQWAEASHRRS
jgi:RimJ/RimL family protein N-acetyltransferase